MSLAASASWPEVELGEICKFAYGKSLPATGRTGTGYPVYGSNGPVGLHEQPLTAGETIVIGRKGSFGEVHYSPGPCSPIDTTYYITQDQTNAYIPWLARRLRCLDLHQLNRAAAIPGLNRADAYRQKLLLPPLTEQKRIAAILDAADALRAKRRESLAQLDTLLQSTFLDMFGDPVANPMGWEEVRLDSLCSDVADCPHSTPKYSEVETDYACIRSPDIQNGCLDFSQTKYVDEVEYLTRVRRLVPEPDDVVYCREGARFGNAALVTSEKKVCLGQRMMLLRIDQQRASAPYVCRVLNNSNFYLRVKRMVGGSASPHTNVKDIRALTIPRPYLDLQRRFATMVEVIERQKDSQLTHLAELDTLFASLQSRAFRGDL